jgi:16S rRNA (cytosine1402-N4)-methyltransferase
MTEGRDPYHLPVLAGAIRQTAVGVRRAVDGTLGDGGHAALLREAGAEVLGIDRDPAAILQARGRLGDDRMDYLEERFDSPVALEAIRAFQPDLVLLDLGVSSRQLDEADRGFSFRPGVPLDMRMDPRAESAAVLLNTWTEAELRQVFRDYGDERRAGRLAQEVVRRRRTTPFATSDDLVRAIRAVLGPRSGPAHFARIFQAVRIAVNQELDRLDRALPALLEALVPGGRLAVISYHSGEDRIVKHHFQEWARACICPPDLPLCRCRGRPLGVIQPRRPIRPDPDEIARNPRARSAALRVFRKALGS